MTKITTHVDPKGRLYVTIKADITIDRSTATALAYIIANRIRQVEGKGEVLALRGLPTVNLGDDIEYVFIDEDYP